MQRADLVRLAELMKLVAKTVQSFPDTTGCDYGQHSRVLELGQRVEAAADELLVLARAIEAAAPKDG